jgi:hypothetical protein
VGRGDWRAPRFQIAPCRAIDVLNGVRSQAVREWEFALECFAGGAEWFNSPRTLKASGYELVAPLTSARQAPSLSIQSVT